MRRRGLFFFPLFSVEKALRDTGSTAPGTERVDLVVHEAMDDWLILEPRKGRHDLPPPFPFPFFSPVSGIPIVPNVREAIDFYKES